MQATQRYHCVAVFQFQEGDPCLSIQNEGEEVAGELFFFFKIRKSEVKGTVESLRKRYDFGETYSWLCRAPPLSLVVSGTSATTPPLQAWIKPGRARVSVLPTHHPSTQGQLPAVAPACHWYGTCRLLNSWRVFT